MGAGQGSPQRASPDTKSVERLTAAQRRAYERLPAWLADRWLRAGARLTDLDRLRDRDFAHWVAEQPPAEHGHSSFGHTLHRLAEVYRRARAQARFDTRTEHLLPDERSEVAAILARLGQKYLFIPEALRDRGPAEPEQVRLRGRWWLAHRRLRTIERGDEPLTPELLLDLEDELDRLGLEIEQLQRSAGEPSTVAEAADPATVFARLHLLPDAPYPVAYAAYRALARLHHPDHGGDPGRMQELNAAWEQIRAIYRVLSPEC